MDTPEKRRSEAAKALRDAYDAEPEKDRLHTVAKLLHRLCSETPARQYYTAFHLGYQLDEWKGVIIDLPDGQTSLLFAADGTRELERAGEGCWIDRQLDIRIFDDRSRALSYIRGCAEGAIHCARKRIAEAEAYLATL